MRITGCLQSTVTYWNSSGTGFMSNKQQSAIKSKSSFSLKRKNGKKRRHALIVK